MNKPAVISRGFLLGHDYCPDVRLFYFVRERGIQPGDGVDRMHGDRSRPLIFFIQKGRGWVETNAGHFDLKAGDMICLFPQKELCWQANLEDPWEYLSLELIGDHIEETLNRLGFFRASPVQTPENPQKSIAVIEEFSNTFYSLLKEPFALQETLYRLLVYLNDLREQKQQNREVERATAYIRLNYNQPITVAGLAEMCSLSRSYFSRLFHQETGRTVQEYLINCRLKAAKQLLRESNFNMEQIALMVGFRTASAFYKTFRSREGMVPSQYRRSRK